MSASIRAVHDEAAAHFASLVAGITLHGTGTGGIWPTPLRVSNAKIPQGQLAIGVEFAEPPKRWANAGGFQNQRHAGTLRLAARAPSVGDIATPYALIKACIDAAHGVPPSGYSTWECLTGIPRILPNEVRGDLPILYADWDYVYFET